MKKLLTLVVMACTSLGAWADDYWSENDDNAWYNYEIVDDKAVIKGIGFNEGKTSLTIPSQLKEKGDNGRTAGNMIDVSGVGIGNWTKLNTEDKRNNITSITISEGITSIGQYAFYDWDGITSITFPTTLTSIGEQAFNDCSALTAVNIPANVTTLGSNIFQSCTALTSITINSIASSFDSWAFAKINDGSSQKFNDNTTIYAPFKIIKQLNNTTDGKLKDYSGEGLEYNALNVVLDETENIRSYGSIDVHVKTDETFTVKRTLHRGHWNTICLPVDVDWTAWDTQLGTGWKLCEFSGCTENVMTFNSVSQVPAKNVPYLLWVPTKAEESTIAEMTFTAVAGTYLQIWESDPNTNKDPYYMNGNMNGVDQKVPNGALFIYNDKVYRSQGNSPMKAMSAYFTVPSESPAPARSFSFSVDGETTGIISIEKDGSINIEETVYDLQGRKVTNPKHGLYIINGKKIMK